MGGVAGRIPLHAVSIVAEHRTHSLIEPPSPLILPCEPSLHPLTIMRALFRSWKLVPTLALMKTRTFTFRRADIGCKLMHAFMRGVPDLGYAVPALKYFEHQHYAKCGLSSCAQQWLVGKHASAILGSPISQRCVLLNKLPCQGHEPTGGVICTTQAVAEFKLCCPLPPGWSELTDNTGCKLYRCSVCVGSAP